jgi:putative transposase
MRPTREHATHNQQTYFVSSQLWGRRQLFKNERWAKLFLDTLFHYRGAAFFLHEFVLMPEHFHLLITPLTSLEKAVQFIKGGFSHRARVELGSNMEVWQKGFTDHRIRDASDYDQHVAYIFQNPVARRLCLAPIEYPFCSACRKFELDDAPQRLKPLLVTAPAARLEAAPLQSRPNALTSFEDFKKRVRSADSIGLGGRLTKTGT